LFGEFFRLLGVGTLLAWTVGAFWAICPATLTVATVVATATTRTATAVIAVASVTTTATRATTAWAIAATATRTEVQGVYGRSRSDWASELLKQFVVWVNLGVDTVALCTV
jgi:hypothetical protein